MILEIDSLGSPLRNFEELRDELVAINKKFDAEALTHIPYEKLAHCATAMAGSAMCPLALVREEKRARRERFLGMSDDDLRDSKILLQIEQMDADVVRDRARNRSPKWEDLHPRQQVWFKLNCIMSHLDNVTVRMAEAVDLLRLVQEKHDLPDDFTIHQRQRLESLMQIYPMRLSDPLFRMKISEIAFEIKKFLPDDEQRVCDAEVLESYSCTSDCYRPLV
jgi:hypothetical protein